MQVVAFCTHHLLPTLLAGLAAYLLPAHTSGALSG